MLFKKVWILMNIKLIKNEEKNIKIVIFIITI